MFRNAVGAIHKDLLHPCRQRGSDDERKKTSSARHCQPRHCRITYHSRFYVASLRRCVRPSFAFLTMRHVIHWAKIFCLTQRRNDATLRAKQNLQSPP